MSVPRLSPAAATASPIRSRAARLLSRLGREAALVAEPGGQTLLLQHRLQRVVDLGPALDRLPEGGRADRRDHELLDVDVGVGMRTAVEDVHHRDRQQVGVRAADVAIERETGRVGRGAGHRQGGAEDRVRAEVRLVGRAVEVDHGLVDEPLVVGVEALERGTDPLDHPGHGLLHALAAVRPSSPSRSSTASKAPVDAPLGTAARANDPSSRITSTSTVGLPRESRISRAPTASMIAMRIRLATPRGRTVQHPRGGRRPGRPGAAQASAPWKVRR